MGDFSQHGMVLRRYMRSLSRVNNLYNQEVLVQFAAHCKSADYAASTCKSYTRTAENFLSYINVKNTLRRSDLGTTKKPSIFLQKKAGAVKMLNQKLSGFVFGRSP